eukprot:10717237-Alexandrium_andersonii.AAC.1
MGLPQGDPWAPLGCLAVVAPPLRRINVHLGDTSVQILFHDDRSGLTRMLASMRAAIALRAQFAGASGPPTNDGKTQRWARTPTASKELSEPGDFQAVGEGV